MTTLHEAMPGADLPGAARPQAVAPQTCPPLLVFAIGNASRGDDALGPALAAALREQGWFDDGRTELIETFQLQVEHALELSHRRAVLFVDAARSASKPGVRLQSLACAARDATPFSHALPPAALLAVHQRINEGAAPPCWLLAIDGERFELGAPLTPLARIGLATALPLAQGWLRSE
ncbi:MAG: hydrogenase maturation protease [Burkholderiaceae bacterium]